jgi:hypothetical protein
VSQIIEERHEVPLRENVRIVLQLLLTDQFVQLRKIVIWHLGEKMMLMVIIDV